jgi:hypothetical protein
VRLLFVQAAALVALTAYLVVLDLTDAGDLGVAISLTVLAALGGGVVFLIARALARRSARARGPAIVVQLFLIASGGFLLNVGPAWAGALLMAFGVVVGALCLLPPTTKALGLG